MKLLNEIQQKLKAGKDQVNSAQGYNYRSCEGILEAVKPFLGEGTLVMTDEMVMLGNGMRDNVTQVTDRNGNTTVTHFPDSRYYIKATVTIDDGIGESVSCSAYAREPFSKKGTDAPKLTGTASSYARKYALCGLFCIDDTKDADTDEYANEQNQQPNNNANNNQQGAW